MTAAVRIAATDLRLLFDENLAPSLVQRLFGNCSTDDVERALRGRYETIVDFAQDDTAALLVIARP